jgi:sec-independent protein translocase protein TatA
MFFGLGGPELALLLVLGVVLFGKHLPSVGRHVAQTMVEVKKAVTGTFDAPPAALTTAPEPARPLQRVTAPKFDQGPASGV